MNTKTDFTLKVIRQLIDNGFSIFLHNKDNLDGYGGWLEADIDNKEICVAMKHHMGFEILLHEYCHFLQYKNDRAFWDGSNEYYELLFNWVDDPDLSLSDEELEKSLKSIIEIEHDCESRALKIIELNPIEDFDIVKYKKAANAYLWSYHLMRELRQKPKRPIYSERVLLGMSDFFEKDLSFYLDKINLTQEAKNSLLLEF